mgnify:CR=1 FL=1
MLESGGKRFRLTRNFGRQNANAKLVCLTDGEVLSVEDGDLSMLRRRCQLRLCMIIRLRVGQLKRQNRGRACG